MHFIWYSLDTPITLHTFREWITSNGANRCSIPVPNGGLRSNPHILSILHISCTAQCLAISRLVRVVQDVWVIF